MVGSERGEPRWPNTSTLDWCGDYVADFDAVLAVGSNMADDWWRATEPAEKKGREDASA